MKTIQKSIEITAPKEKVWAVLLEDLYRKEWSKAFGDGLSTNTDWIEGHKVIIIDMNNTGMLGRVVEKHPYEKLSIVYEGLVKNGEEDTNSEEAKMVKGFTETYTLTEENDNTWLSISCDMDDRYYDTMSEAWENALKKISEYSLAV